MQFLKLFVNFLKSSSLQRAFPESIESAAISAPSLKFCASPAPTRQKAEFTRTTSLFAPFSFPLSISKIILAFSLLSPPLISPKECLLIPKSSGRMEYLSLRLNLLWNPHFFVEVFF